MPTSTWDFEDMCVAIALPSGARNTFAYDGALKRRRAEDSAGLVRFVHDGENVLLETDGGGATQVSYTLEPAGYGNLISQRRGSASSWHHFDALGSTDRLTDAGESELACYVQTAFGVLKATTGSHPNRLRWIGRLGYRWEPDTSHYDVRRRRYDPARGRWVSLDSLVGVSRLAYVGNDPVNRNDPTGLWWDEAHRMLSRTLAQRAAVLRTIGGQQYVVRFPQEAPGEIGRGSHDVDHGAFRVTLSYHFDPGRQAASDAEFSAALLFAQMPCCQAAWYRVGTSTHPVQDATAHLDLKPCDHLDARNYPYVDTTGYSRGTQIPGSHQFRKAHNAGWDYEAAVFGLRCEGRSVRVWQWKRGGQRWRDAYGPTCDILERFLSQAAGCFEKTAACDETTPPKSCR